MGELKNIKGQKIDEKTEAALALCERYRLIHDESGHDYVIKVWQTNDFYAWVRMTEEEPEAGAFNEHHDFNEDRINGGLLTFTDPRVG